jgi:outer membrane protein assembly factor BamB
MRSQSLAIVLVCCASILLALRPASAQGRGGQNWTTNNADAQRTSWVRTDPRISRESLQKPGFQLLWKARLENQPRQLNSLTQPLLLGNIISYKGFKALAFVGGSADNVYSIDYDLNRMFWTRRLTSVSSSSGTPLCPGGLTAITRATPLIIPNPAAARGGAGGTPPQPLAGGAGRGSPPPTQPAAPPARAGGAPPPNSNLANAIYAIASDGTVHILNPQTGQDLSPPVKFLNPVAKVNGSILIDNVLYASTADRCGNVANGVYALDLGEDSATVAKWLTNGGSVVGNVGPTMGSDGTVYVATSDGDMSATSFSNSIVSLHSRTLTLKDSFSPGKTPFTSAPIVFPLRDKDVVAAANKDGRIYLLDGASLGGTDHKIPLARSAQFSTGGSEGLASWEDADGARWVVAASSGPPMAEAQVTISNGNVINGSVVGFKVVQQGSNLAMQPAWASRDIASPSSPIVINGVVFVLARGGQRAGSAVLYALDGMTGRELWTSGNTMTSFVHSGGLSGGDGQVYVGTFDSTLYAFGIPLEH